MCDRKGRGVACQASARICRNVLAILEFGVALRARVGKRLAIHVHHHLVDLAPLGGPQPPGQGPFCDKRQGISPELLAVALVSDDSAESSRLQHPSVRAHSARSSPRGAGCDSNCLYMDRAGWHTGTEVEHSLAGKLESGCVFSLKNESSRGRVQIRASCTYKGRACNRSRRRIQT